MRHALFFILQGHFPCMSLVSTVWDVLFGLVVNGVLLTIPLLVLVGIDLFLFNRVKSQTKWKWFQTAFASIFILVAGILIIVTIWNVGNGFIDTNVDQIPPDVRNNPQFQLSQVNLFLLLGQGILQSLLSGLILSAILLPFAFVGMGVFEWLQKKRNIPVWEGILLTCFLGALLLLILLAAFPWIPVSLLYLAFFGI